MNKIGIISGAGLLPLMIGKNLIDKNYEICFFCIKDFADKSIYKEFETEEISITSFSMILNLLNQKNIDSIIMVGNISRPSLKDIKFDFKTIGLIKDYFLESKGDDQLLKLISKFFLKNGYPLFDWKNNCKELFSNIDNLTIHKPSKDSNLNKNKGLEVFKIIGKADIGQSIVIQNQILLGVECFEGTNELIKRCDKYKKSTNKKILIKLSKYSQHTQLDLPTIGIQTVENLSKYNYEGLYIEKNKCIIIEKQKVIDFCNKNNLFLSTVNKID